MERDIVKFLIRAKKATYAGKGAGTAPSRPASHDLRYDEGPLAYIDTYLGGELFAGEEAIWKDGIPFWSMNYIGRVVAEGLSGDFLKEAMLLVPEDKPFRGPERYESGDYTYTCTVDGDTDWFSGREEIFFKGVLVYECLYHGGAVKQ